MMTTEEAKLILQSYRPGTEDVADPLFAEALELANTDTELGHWLARQRAFDEVMGRTLQSEVPPVGLRTAILARQPSPQGPRRLRPVYSLPLLVALAAAIMLFVGIAVFHHVSPTDSAMTVASFTRQALDIKEQGKISLGTMSPDPAVLRAWLAERGTPHDFILPPGLRGIPALGCQSYNLGGTKVSLICFTLGKNQIAHLFVVEKSALADASSDSHPQLREENGLAFATWTSGGKSYVLTGDNVTKETLQKLI